MRGCDWPQDVGEIGDGQFGLGQQRQDAQARLLARGLERGVESIETELAAVAGIMGLIRAPMGQFPPYKDIFIR